MRRMAIDMLVTFFLSLSISYMAWAVPWEVWAFQAGRPGSDGAVTTMEVNPLGNFDAEDLTSTDLALRLEGVMADEGVALYVTSVVFGRPVSAVIDPGGTLGWMPPGAEEGTAYPFEGSYLAGAGGDGLADGYLPSGYRLGAAIEKPPTIRYSPLQYACLWDPAQPIAIGSYVVTSADPEVVAEVCEAFEGSVPVAVSASSRSTFPSFAIHEPPLVLGGLLLLGGVVVALLYLVTRLALRRGYFRVAWQSGASWQALARRDVAGVAVLALPAACAAALLTSLVPSLVSPSPVPVSPLGTFLVGWLASWLTAVLLQAAVGSVYLARTVGRWERA